MKDEFSLISRIFEVNLVLICIRILLNIFGCLSFCCKNSCLTTERWKWAFLILTAIMNITGMVGFVLIANNYENFVETSDEFYLITPLSIVVETIQGLHTIQIMPSVIILGASIGSCVSSICDKI